MSHELPLSSPPPTFSCHVYVGPAADAVGIVRARIATLPAIVGEGSTERTALAAVVAAFKKYAAAAVAAGTPIPWLPTPEARREGEAERWLAVHL
ncbi:MAG: hypothetical protein K8U03_22580 [Planctomycetia bacterium]|nr:hypothetical protein [Planctomycetia bacterium]